MITKEQQRIRNKVASSKSKYKKYRTILALKNVPCADCKNKYPVECMDFDHVIGVKRFNIMNKIHAFGIKTLLDEIAKCQVVCANCHRIRTTKRKPRNVNI